MNGPEFRIPPELAAQPAWVKLLIQLLLSALSTYIAGKNINPAVQAQVQKVIADGQALESML